jgi:small subunit ribosomal protein S27Ae
MHILVKTLTGQACSLKLGNEQTVEKVQSEVESLMGVPSSEQNLIFNGKRLTVGNLSEFGIVENSNVYLVVDLEGGAKGKKKKKDTKKGKKKHKKRKVKLQVLRYYRVEDGKIVRVKQMCKVCPPGTFIAEHPDRLYCGRCHTAYTKVIDSSAPAKGKPVQDKGKPAEKAPAQEKGKPEQKKGKGK